MDKFAPHLHFFAPLTASPGAQPRPQYRLALRSRHMTPRFYNAVYAYGKRGKVIQLQQQQQHSQ